MRIVRFSVDIRFFFSSTLLSSHMFPGSWDGCLMVVWYDKASISPSALPCAPELLDSGPSEIDVHLFRPLILHNAPIPILGLFPFVTNKALRALNVLITHPSFCYLSSRLILVIFCHYCSLVNRQTCRPLASGSICFISSFSLSSLWLFAFLRFLFLTFCVWCFLWLLWYLLGRKLSNSLCQGLYCLTGFVWVEMFASTCCNPACMLRTSWKNKCRAVVLGLSWQGFLLHVTALCIKNGFVAVSLVKKCVLYLWI